MAEGVGIVFQPKSSLEIASFYSFLPTQVLLKIILFSSYWASKTVPSKIAYIVINDLDTLGFPYQVFSSFSEIVEEEYLLDLRFASTWVLPVGRIWKCSFWNSVGSLNAVL